MLDPLSVFMHVRVCSKMSLLFSNFAASVSCIMPPSALISPVERLFLCSELYRSLVCSELYRSLTKNPLKKCVCSELYGSPTAVALDARAGIATDAIDAVMSRCVLPLVPQLLKEEDPMPLYALKVSLCSFPSCRARWSICCHCIVAPQHVTPITTATHQPCHNVPQYATIVMPQLLCQNRHAITAALGRPLGGEPWLRAHSGADGAGSSVL